MLEQCVQLKKLGHDVTVAYNAPGDLLPLYEEANVGTIRMNAYSPRRRQLPADIMGLVANLTRSIALPLDLVAANSYHSTFFAAALARLKRIPLVCHLRLNPPLSLSLPPRLGLREVSRFIAESASVRDLWMARGARGDTIDIVHDGIDVNRFHPGLDAPTTRRALGLGESDYVLLSGGRIDPVKDLEGLLTTFAIVRKQAANARLLVAGTPSSFATEQEGENYLRDLKQLAMSLGVGADVRWLGHRSDMPELYAAADVITLFGAIPEPFGRVTCEALACGRPMVTPRQGGSSEIMQGEFSKLLFRPGDYEEAARIILSLRGWQHRDPDFSARARAHIRREFDLSAMGARMEQALAKAIVAGPRPNGPSYDSFRAGFASPVLGRTVQTG